MSERTTWSENFEELSSLSSLLEQTRGIAYNGGMALLEAGKNPAGANTLQLKLAELNAIQTKAAGLQAEISGYSPTEALTADTYPVCLGNFLKIAALTQMAEGIVAEINQVLKES